LTTDFLPSLQFDTIVYHCVDEIKAAPGMPRDAIERSEAELICRADVVFVTAPRLAESRCRLNPNTHYLPNVADYGHFSKSLEPTTLIPDDLARISEPRIGFVGAISTYKLDFNLLVRVAQAHPEWSIVLIGQVGEGDPWTDISGLRSISNIHLLGPRPYAMLPAYLRGLRVGLLPNRLNDYTASMFPMKFFEYLAAGLPVVSTDLPALRDYADVAMLAQTPQEFIEAIESALAKRGPELENRLARAKQHTYASRMDAMLDILGRRDYPEQGAGNT
jgi:glycosyltransferase involved in cell wall biosynthesis